MANTGYIINPTVIQIFTSGPNSGSEVSSSYNINFDIGSSFTSSILCGNEYNYRIFDPINCEIDDYCMYPTIISISPMFCYREYNFAYIVKYLVNSSLISNSIIEYSLTSDFTGEIGSSSLTNSPDLNTVRVNIAEGLTTLPLNGYTNVYFRMKNICSGILTSSYTEIISSSCIETEPEPLTSIVLHRSADDRCLSFEPDLPSDFLNPFYDVVGGFYGNTYFINSPDFLNSTILKQPGGTLNAAAAWYSDGIISRRWNGNEFTLISYCL